ncbi:MAG: beta-class carbonic anhydrase [Phycisphaeraceae bacterium]
MLVITCMDARINIEAALGLKPGEAHILRNAGGTVTQDILQSVVVSTNLLGTRQIMVINHTQCGMMSCTDQDLRDKLSELYGPSPQAPDRFNTFTDLEQHAREQVHKLRSHPWVPADTAVRGFTYDVRTGKLHEVDCT